MANINHPPSKYMLNLLHVLPAFAEWEAENVINSLVEINAGSINKYEFITETWTLQLDRVWYSSLAYPFSYWAIPCTWDEDDDMLDTVIVNVTEEFVPWSLVRLRVIGVIKFVDWGEVDDKIVAVVHDDKRQEHITNIDQLWEYWKKETQHYLEYYKHLKKPWTCEVGWFFGVDEALKTIRECEERYKREYLPKFED
jgi:inorganic pyrophosphatase